MKRKLCSIIQETESLSARKQWNDIYLELLALWWNRLFGLQIQDEKVGIISNAYQFDHSSSESVAFSSSDSEVRSFFLFFLDNFFKRSLVFFLCFILKKSIKTDIYEVYIDYRSGLGLFFGLLVVPFLFSFLGSLLLTFRPRSSSSFSSSVQSASATSILSSES